MTKLIFVFFSLIFFMAQMGCSHLPESRAENEQATEVDRLASLISHQRDTIRKLEDENSVLRTKANLRKPAAGGAVFKLAVSGIRDLLKNGGHSEALKACNEWIQSAPMGMAQTPEVLEMKVTALQGLNLNGFAERTKRLILRSYPQSASARRLQLSTQQYEITR